MHVSTLANCLFIRQLAGPVSQSPENPWTPEPPARRTPFRLWSVYICTKRATLVQKQTQTETLAHRYVASVCVSINISLAHSPSETPKFCNIYKVAKKRRSPPKPNRIESRRSESEQPSRADRLTEPQKCTLRKVTKRSNRLKYLWLKIKSFQYICGYWDLLLRDLFLL